MKKFLTSVLATVMLALTIAFTACASTGDTTYKGNYQEIDSQQLYTATKDLSQAVEGNFIGIKIDMKVSQSSISDNSESSSCVEFSGAVVNTGENYILANLKMVVRESTETTSIKNTHEMTVNFYIDGYNYYMHTIISKSGSSGNTSEETKQQISQSTFNDILEESLNSSGGEVTIPSTESGFIDYVQELCDTKGYKFSADLTNGSKIKVEIGDLNAFSDYMKSQNTSIYNILVEVNEYEMFYIYDKDNNFVAEKVSQDVSVSNSYNTSTVKVNSELKAYNGNVTLPTDLDTYTFNP